MKLQLWSIQDVACLEDFDKYGYLRCPNYRFIKEWESAYDWMRSQMNKRIGVPELSNQYPIWAWYQYRDAKHKKPDLRRSAHLPRGNKGVRIKFTKDSSEVLLSDFDLWQQPLCFKSYIATNEQDHIVFEQKLKDLNLENAKFFELPTFLRKEIEKSWEKIFDMEYDWEYWTQPFESKMIQACCWEIRSEEIEEIQHFVAR